MKVYIGGYRNHFLSPYIILEKFFFWRKDYDAYENKPPQWLTDTMEGISSFLDKLHPRIEHVKIDSSDVWSMDSTLGLIILPMLKKLKDDQQSSGFVYNEDVPEHLKSFNAPRVEYDWDTDEFYHDRWAYVLDEMIFAFENINIDWEDQFKTGVSDWKFTDSGMVEGPNHTMKYDWVGWKAHEARIQNGFRLFGVYFRSLWS